MKAILIEITEDMSQEEKINSIYKNQVTLNEHQHQREKVIFDRYQQLQSSMDSQFKDVRADIKKIIDHMSGKKLLTEEN